VLDRTRRQATCCPWCDYVESPIITGEGLKWHLTTARKRCVKEAWKSPNLGDIWHLRRSGCQLSLWEEIIGPWSQSIGNSQSFAAV